MSSNSINVETPLHRPVRPPAPIFAAAPTPTVSYGDNNMMDDGNNDHTSHVSAYVAASEPFEHPQGQPHGIFKLHTFRYRVA